VPFNIGDGVGIGLAKGHWRRNGGLVRVETDIDLNLGRVIALKRR
jgi:hypothetical protein